MLRLHLLFLNVVFMWIKQHIVMKRDSLFFKSQSN